MMKNKLLIPCGTVFIALIIWELWVRFTFRAPPFAPPPFVPPHLTERDATLRWRFPPGEKRNGLGLRNREIAPKPAGTFRILILGDSLVWGSNTTSGKLWTALLEDRLNARFATAVRRYEVINAGVPGYTTYQELEFLKIYGKEMLPDYVILGFVFNDLYYPYLHAPTPESIIGPEPALWLNRFDPDSLPGFLFGQSYLANQLAFGAQILWRQQVLRREMFPFELKGDFYLAWKEHPWKRTRQLIREMRDTLASRGIPLAIMVYPLSDQVNDKYLALDRNFVLFPQSKIKEIASTERLPHYDLTDVVYRNGGVSLYLDYLHLNSGGNDIVLGEVEQFITKELSLTP